jgi:predicted HD phosphohydrolase
LVGGLLAMTAGATGDLVAAALGHESFTTTERHYARPDAISEAHQAGALRELEKSSRPFPRAA